MVKGIKEENMKEDEIKIVKVKERDEVGEMIKGIGGEIDVIVKRGGKRIVERVKQEERVKVLENMEGI